MDPDMQIKGVLQEKRAHGGKRVIQEIIQETPLDPKDTMFWTEGDQLHPAQLMKMDLHQSILP